MILRCPRYMHTKALSLFLMYISVILSRTVIDILMVCCKCKSLPVGYFIVVTLNQKKLTMERKNGFIVIMIIVMMMMTPISAL